MDGCFSLFLQLLGICVVQVLIICQQSVLGGSGIRGRILPFPHTYCFNSGKLVNLSEFLFHYDLMDANRIMSQNGDEG